MTYKTFTFLFRPNNLLIICSCFCKPASASSFTFSKLFVVFCLEKYRRRMLHLTQNTRQTLGWWWPGWWPGAVPDLVSMCWCLVICLNIGIPAHSQSPGLLSLHCPGQLNLRWMAEGVSPLWSVQLSLLLPSFLWFVSESRNARQQRGNRGMLPRRLVSQQLLLCPLVSSLYLSPLIKSYFFSPPHIYTQSVSCSQTLWLLM